MAAIRSSRFDLPLTYDAGDLELEVGDVVRVPLGAREVLAFVVTPPEEVDLERALRKVIARAAVPRAFTPVGLALARFVADRYLCTLGEALSAVVLAGAIPRAVDRFVLVAERPNRARYPSVPARLVSLIWEEFPDGFTFDQLLRHPDARRTGDRAALLRFANALVRSGEIRRERTFRSPRTQ
ncbi:MAG: primosomal protein N' family DNA-binding protein, partial [Vulcanimicrobiaceae bacterium]